jgi:YD repeat-containing protein
VTRHADALGNVSTFAYDTSNRKLSQTVSRTNNVAGYAYDDAGRRVSVTDALGNVSKFAYDAVGNQISFTDALSGAEGTPTTECLPTSTTTMATPSTMVGLETSTTLRIIWFNEVTPSTAMS